MYGLAHTSAKAAANIMSLAPVVCVIKYFKGGVFWDS